MCATRSSCSATQIRQGWRLSRPQDNLACDGAPSLGIPHRLSCDTVAMAVDFSFEDVHVLSCSILKAKNQAKSNISATFRLGGPPRRSQVCEGRARAALDAARSI